MRYITTSSCLPSLATLVLAAISSGCRGAAAPTAPPPALAASPTAAVSAVTIAECAVDDRRWPTWGDPAACFGADSTTGVDPIVYGQGEDGELQLSFGGATYKVVNAGRPLPEVAVNTELPYVLSRDGRILARLSGRVEVDSPSRNLTSFGGHVSWEFDDGTTSTAIVDGEDVRRRYGVDAAFAPYSIGGHLVVMTRRAGRYAVLVDGERLGEEYDEVEIAYCCEAALFSILRSGGWYQFLAKRAGHQFHVAVRVGT